MAITVVQHQTISGRATGTTSESATFAATPGAGNLTLALGTCFNLANSPETNQTTIDYFTSGNDDISSYYEYAPAVSPGSTYRVLTTSNGASNLDYAGILFEVAGALSSSPVNQHATTTATQTAGVGTVTTSSITPTVNGCWIVAWVSYADSASNAVSASGSFAGSEIPVRSALSADPANLVAASFIQTTKAAVSCTFTMAPTAPGQTGVALGIMAIAPPSFTLTSSDSNAAPSDTEGLVGSVTEAETNATPADAQSLASSLTGSDSSAAPADAQSLAGTIAGSDSSAALSDAQSLAGSIAASETTNAPSDTQALQGSIQASESNSSPSDAALLASLLAQAEANATLADAQALSAQLEGVDSNANPADVAHVAAALTQADSNNAPDDSATATFSGGGPPSVFDSSHLVPIHAAIKRVLTNEMAASGRLSGIKSIGDSWLNGTNLYPFLGLMAHSRKEAEEAFQRRSNTITYAFLVVNRSEVSLDDAYQGLHALMDSGTGNGLEPVLRDSNNYVWYDPEGSVLSQYQSVSNVVYTDNFTENKQNNNQGPFIAYASLMYTVVQHMRWVGQPPAKAALAADSTVLALQSAIKLALTNEMGLGGRIAGVQAVGDSWFNQVNAFPYVGLTVHARREESKQLHRRTNVVTLGVLLSYRSTISLDDAHNQMQVAMDDGYGFGIENILRDPANFSWLDTNGNALNAMSYIDSVAYSDNFLTENKQSNSNTGPFIAYASLALEVTQFIQTGNVGRSNI